MCPQIKTTTDRAMRVSFTAMERGLPDRSTLDIYLREDPYLDQGIETAFEYRLNKADGPGPVGHVYVRTGHPGSWMRAVAMIMEKHFPFVPDTKYSNTPHGE